LYQLKKWAERMAENSPKVQEKLVKLKSLENYAE
jgi:hypothetical protein